VVPIVSYLHIHTLACCGPQCVGVYSPAHLLHLSTALYEVTRPHLSSRRPHTCVVFYVFRHTPRHTFPPSMYIDVDLHHYSVNLVSSPLTKHTLCVHADPFTHIYNIYLHVYLLTSILGELAGFVAFHNTATHHNTLQNTAPLYNPLQSTATHFNPPQPTLST